MEKLKTKKDEERWWAKKMSAYYLGQSRIYILSSSLFS